MYRYYKQNPSKHVINHMKQLGTFNKADIKISRCMAVTHNINEKSIYASKKYF